MRENISKDKMKEREILKWRWIQIYLQKKYMGTPPGFQNSAEAGIAKAKWKADVQEYRHTLVYHLESNVQGMPEPFVGREDLLHEIEESFRSGKGPVALFGIGGIGKSALAREYIRKYEKQYDHILFLNYEKDIQSMIAEGVVIRNLEYTEEYRKRPRKYFLTKYRVIQEIAKCRKVLMVVDGFNCCRDRDLNVLFEFHGDLLLTTKLHPCIWKKACTGLRVTELSRKEEWNGFIREYQQTELSPADKNELRLICRKNKGHTLAMKLQIRSLSGLTENLENEYEAFQQNLFRCFSLKQREKNAIMYLSIMPHQGIPLGLFRRISDIHENVIHQLINYLLVSKLWDESREEEILSIHPVIAQAARKEFNPTCSNCYYLIVGFSKYLTGNTAEEKSIWEKTWEENKQLEPYIFAVLRAFPEPEAWLADSFDELVEFLCIQRYFRDAEAYSLRIFHAVEKYYGEFHQNTGKAAIRIGNVYCNAREFRLAREWYRKGYEILKNCKPADTLYQYYYAAACGKISWMYLQDGLLDKAYQMQEEALQNMEEQIVWLKRNNRERYADARICYSYAMLNKAKILLQSGKVKEARNLYDRLFEEAPSKIKKSFRLNEFQNFLIELLLEEGAIEEACCLARETLKRAVIYRGEDFEETLSCRRKLKELEQKKGGGHKDRKDGGTIQKNTGKTE